MEKQKIEVLKVSSFLQQSEIILRRSDFLRLHDYALNYAPLRDFCLIRLPMKTGLRPGEIQQLCWPQINFETLTIDVVDSKNDKRFPIPMDPVTADYLRQLKEKFRGHWVFPHDPESHAWNHWTSCLTYDGLGKAVKKWARLAGCENWQRMTLYLLRHFFAANWAYPPNGRRPGNLHALSRILRHKSLAYTQVYLSRLVFYEDLQAEYNYLQGGPFIPREESKLAPGQVETRFCGNEFFDQNCRICGHQSTCRFVEQAMSSPWAISCKYFTPKMQTESKTLITE